MALESATSPDGLIDDARARLMRAIESYDEAAVPGRARQRSGRLRVEISQEHFASNLIRGRLLSLARLWGRGSGPLALLACPPGEQHDISLLAFGLILRSHGWRILFLGANTPLSTTYATARMTAPAAIVLVTFGTALVKTEGASLRRLARITPDKRVICRHATAARPPACAIAPGQAPPADRVCDRYAKVVYRHPPSCALRRTPGAPRSRHRKSTIFDTARTDQSR